MIETALARNSFSSSEIEEIIRENEALKESQAAILKDSVEILTLLSDIAKEEKILYGRQLAEFTTKAADAIKADDSVDGKIMVAHAYAKKQIANIKKALKTRPPAAGTEDRPRPQAITRIQIRAMALVDHIKVLAKDAKSKIAFTSRDARTYLAGLEGRAPSRRDTIRALHRAVKLCPAIDIESTPGDGRETKRLILDVEVLEMPAPGENIFETGKSRSLWQRSRWEEVRTIFNLG